MQIAQGAALGYLFADFLGRIKLPTEWASVCDVSP